MCRLKCYTLSQKCIWRSVYFSGCILLVLGATSFGFGMKLMEFAEKPDITPVFAGIPMIAAGFLGLASGMCRKGWLVTFYGIMCVIISMLSIHMNYRFMGKELPSLPIYRDQCLSKPKIQYHCDKYVGTLVLCSVAVVMLPFIIAGLLSCVAAKRTLKKKTCCVIWFTCSEVHPAQPAHEKFKRHYKQRQNNHPVALLNYKNTSNSFVCEIPETRTTSEYLPRLPGFTDIAGHPESPGYPASVMFEFEKEDSQKGIRGSGEVSKDVKLRKENYGVSQVKGQKFALIESGLPKNAETKNVQRWKGESSGVATSEADLSLLEQDYLNRRSYLYDEENDKYYDRAVEQWIQKVVENLNDSRSRLYAVSDEEDLKDSDSKESIDKYESKISGECESQNSGSSIVSSLPGQKSSLVENEVDKCLYKTGSPPQEKSSDTRKALRDEKKKLRKRKLGTSTDLNDVEAEDNTPISKSQSDSSVADSQSESSVNGSQSESSINNRKLDSSEEEVVPKDVTQNPMLSIERFETKDLTPHGIVTPTEQPYPTGSLHFEFEKPTPTEHARKNWVEFDGEDEDRKKLLKGKMTLKEYEELTSYVM